MTLALGLVTEMALVTPVENVKLVGGLLKELVLKDMEFVAFVFII